MNRSILALLVILVATVCADWELVFFDDFNGSSINETAWNVANYYYHAGNNEEQIYLASEVRVSNGNLILKSDKCNVNGYNYCSGWVDTRGKFAQKYGKFEFRAQLPAGKGMWPAHWLLPNDNSCWPVEGEIDVMEYIGQDPKAPAAPVYGTLHWSSGGCYQDVHNGGSTSNGGIYFPGGFNVFSVEWNSNQIAWFVNEKQYWSVPASDFSPSVPFYMILNTAVGGFWPGPPDSSTSFPQHHLIDWVKVYQWN